MKNNMCIKLENQIIEPSSYPSDIKMYDKIQTIGKGAFGIVKNIKYHV